MKILAFVDVHGNHSAVKDIKKKAEKADILVGAGDFSIFERGLANILCELNKLNKPVLIVPGNHETETGLKKAGLLFKNIHYIHKKRFKFGGIIFLGYGGGGFSLRDPDFERFAKKSGKGLKKKDNVVLITHAPPHGTKLDRINKEYHGNKSITNFIKKVDLNLVVCGHLHENAGKKDKIGKTVLINPGAHGKIVEI